MWNNLASTGQESPQHPDMETSSNRPYPIEKAFQACFELIALRNMAFPQNQDVPPCFLEASNITTVTGNGSGELYFPQFNISLGHRAFRTTSMSVPKATVDEDHFLSTTKDNIWPSRQIASMESVPVSHTGQSTSNDLFGCRFRRTNPTHSIAGVCVGYIVFSGHHSWIVSGLSCRFERLCGDCRFISDMANCSFQSGHTAIRLETSAGGSRACNWAAHVPPHRKFGR